MRDLPRQGGYQIITVDTVVFGLDHIIYLDQGGVFGSNSTLIQRSFLAWKGKTQLLLLMKTGRPHRRLLFSLGSAVNVKLLK